MKTYGKLILMGEHSVVYGHKAIAIPFRALHVTTYVEKSEEWWIVSDLYEGSLEKANLALKPIKDLLDLLKKDLSLKPIKVTIKSTLPIGSGLGSSAAVATSLVKAVFAYLKQRISQKDLFNYVQFSERIAHGVSSGIDPLITTTSKGYIFSKDGEKEKLSPLKKGFLVVGYSKEVGDTKVAVQRVKEHMKDPNGETRVESLGRLTKEFYKAYGKADLKKMGNLMNQAQKDLEQLSLSTPILDKMTNESRVLGALGAKLTGAGLGGCVLALVEDSLTGKNIQDRWELLGYPSWMMDLTEVV
jgi:mevalonate kinase